MKNQIQEILVLEKLVTIWKTDSLKSELFAQY